MQQILWIRPVQYQVPRVTNSTKFFICECQQHKFAIYLFLCASSFVKYVFVDQNSPDILRFALGQFPRKNHSLILRFAEPRFVLKWPEHDLPQPLLLNPKKGEERTGSLNSSTTL